MHRRSVSTAISLYNLREANAYYSDNGQVVALKAQHKNECKGLIVQIKYLKAKWTRESNWRSDLGYQKQYLLVLLQRSERRYAQFERHTLNSADRSVASKRSWLPSQRLASYPLQVRRA